MHQALMSYEDQHYIWRDSVCLDPSIESGHTIYFYDNTILRKGYSILISSLPGGFRTLVRLGSWLRDTGQH